MERWHDSYLSYFPQWVTLRAFLNPVRFFFRFATWMLSRSFSYELIYRKRRNKKAECNNLPPPQWTSKSISKAKTCNEIQCGCNSGLVWSGLIKTPQERSQHYNLMLIYNHRWAVTKYIGLIPVLVLFLNNCLLLMYLCFTIVNYDFNFTTLERQISYYIIAAKSRLEEVTVQPTTRRTVQCCFRGMEFFLLLSLQF